MAESRHDSYACLEKNIANLFEQELRRFQLLLERRARAASTAPAHDVQQMNTGMFVMMQPPELMRRKSLAVFIKPFRTWACYQRCDEALETDSVVRTGEVIRSVVEEMHGEHLVAQSYMILEALNKALKRAM